MKKIFVTAAVISGLIAAGGSGLAADFSGSPIYVSASDVIDFSDEASVIKFIESSTALITQENYDLLSETCGKVSIHGSYIVLCVRHGFMSSYHAEQSGTAEVSQKLTSLTDAPMATHVDYDVMHIFKAEKPGNLKFDFICSPYGPNTEKTTVYSAELTIDENLIIHEVSEKDNTDSNEVQLPSQKPASVSKGDINSDGSVDLTDISVLSLALIGDTSLNEEQKLQADVDDDGDVSLADLARLRQYISKAITSL